MICNYDECPCRNERPCKCNDCEKGIMILVSIIGGLVFAAVVVLLFINNFLAVPGFAGWTALISALVYLAGLIAAAAVSEKSRKCIRCSLGSLIFGIFGTIFSGYLSIAAAITVGEVFSTIIVALTAFFFAYMIVSTLFLIRCLTRCREE